MDNHLLAIGIIVLFVGFMALVAVYLGISRHINEIERKCVNRLVSMSTEIGALKRTAADIDRDIRSDISKLYHRTDEAEKRMGALTERIDELPFDEIENARKQADDFLEGVQNIWNYTPETIINRGGESK